MKNKNSNNEAEQKTWTVYIHISPSGKRYIGVTSKKKVTERWINGKGYDKCPYFYKAIQKYGWENIQHEILCEGISEEKASQMEVDLIRVYIGAVCHFRALTSMNYFWSFEKINSPELIKKYLNKEITIPILIGGKTKKVIQCDLNNNELKIFNSLKEASEETGITAQQIGYCCKNNTVSGVYRWKYCNDIPYYGDSYFLYWSNHQELLNKFVHY